MYGLVIIHEDGAVLSISISEDEAQHRFAESRYSDSSVVYAHLSDPDYKRICSYTREKP